MGITFRPPYAEELIERLTALGWTIDQNNNPYYNEPWLLAVRETMRLRASYDSRSPWYAIAYVRTADGTVYQSARSLYESAMPQDDPRRIPITIADLLRVATDPEQCQIAKYPPSDWATTDERRQAEEAAQARERAATEAKPEPVARSVGDAEWAIPVSYRQLNAAGVELDSGFDDDAGEGDNLGDIIIRVTLDDDGEIGLDVRALCGTLAKPWPRWTSCMATYYSAKGWVDSQHYRQNDAALMALFDAVCPVDIRAEIHAASALLASNVNADDEDEDDEDSE